jgi:hypothetical protein
MLSPWKIAAFKDEISALEEAHEKCADGGIQKIICLWIEDLRKQVACGSNSLASTAPKPRHQRVKTQKPAH